MPCARAAEAPATPLPTALPKGHDYFTLRDGLRNSWLRFQNEKVGRIAFLGGSITASGGWRDAVIAYFKARFPETKFEFISAGIPSMGSVPHAFRLETDILSKGPIDLLFVEAAVNDTTNTPDAALMLRAMEGIVRHVRTMNRLTDIVHLHFVMPPHMADYRAGRVPESIAQHEKVATAYGNPSLNLALEVTERIDAGQFTWERDFKDLHPSPFGHQLYAASIQRLLDEAYRDPVPELTNPAVKAARTAQNLDGPFFAGPRRSPHPLPAPLDAQNYERGRFLSITEARNLKDFAIDPAWKPTDGKGTRSGFVNVPALVATKPGAEFEFSFNGTAAGLLITSGPDAEAIEYRIDNGEPRRMETSTQWSKSLHLPWALILADDLKNGPHTVKVRLPEPRWSGSATALRVFQLLAN